MSIQTSDSDLLKSQVGSVANPITISRIAFLDVSGSDSTGTIGNPSLPYLTAQAAYNAVYAVANANPSLNYLIKLGIGSFGGVTLTADWPGNIYVAGLGDTLSNLGGIFSQGVNQYPGGQSDSSFNVTINGVGKSASLGWVISIGQIGYADDGSGNAGSGGNSGTVTLNDVSFDTLFVFGGAGGENNSTGETGGLGGNAGNVSIINCRCLRDNIMGNAPFSAFYYTSTPNGAGQGNPASLLVGGGTGGWDSGSGTAGSGGSNGSLLIQDTEFVLTDTAYNPFIISIFPGVPGFVGSGGSNGPSGGDAYLSNVTDRTTVAGGNPFVSAVNGPNIWMQRSLYGSQQVSGGGTFNDIGSDGVAGDSPSSNTIRNF